MLVEIAEVAGQLQCAVLEAEGVVRQPAAGQQDLVELFGGRALRSLQPFVEEAGRKQAVGAQAFFGVGEAFILPAGVQIALPDLAGVCNGVRFGGVGRRIDAGSFPLQGSL